jgi:putative oxidoreductase
MFRRLLATVNDPTLTVLRVALGVAMFAHGAQKVLGWFGGNGFNGTMGFFTNMGIPAPFAFLAICAEFLGGLGLLFGLLSRIGAFGIVVNMLVAVLLVHVRNGFFMNWTGTKPGEGFEYHILAIAMGVTVLVRGAGAYSLDRVLERGLSHRPHLGGTLEPHPAR